MEFIIQVFMFYVFLPLQKLLGQSPSETQSPPDPGGYVSGAETQFLSLHAENVEYVSVEQRHHCYH